MTDLYLLDTNVASALWDPGHKHHQAYRARCATIPDDTLWVSAISVGEVEYGLQRTSKLAAERKNDIRQNMQTFAIRQIDEFVAEDYGKLRAYLFDKYAPRQGKAKSVSDLRDLTTDRDLGIQENDLWIASQASTYGMILVTNDSMNRISEAAQQLGMRLYLQPW